MEESYLSIKNWIIHLGHHTDFHNHFFNIILIIGECFPYIIKEGE